MHGSVPATAISLSSVLYLSLLSLAPRQVDIPCEMAGVKRAAPAKSEQAERRDRVAHFLRSIDSEECDEQSADLATIVAELARAPQKIKRCKQAVLSDLFDPPTNEAEEEFGPTVSYLCKLPKDFLKKVVPHMSGISVGALTKVEKTQKRGVLACPLSLVPA